MTPTGEQLADFFRSRKIEFGKCLEPHAMRSASNTRPFDPK